MGLKDTVDGAIDKTMGFVIDTGKSAAKKLGNIAAYAVAGLALYGVADFVIDNGAEIYGAIQGKTAEVASQYASASVNAAVRTAEATHRDTLETVAKGLGLAGAAYVGARTARKRE